MIYEVMVSRTSLFYQSCKIERLEVVLDTTFNLVNDKCGCFTMTMVILEYVLQVYNLLVFEL